MIYNKYIFSKVNLLIVIAFQIVLLFFHSQNSYAQTDLDNLREIWKAGNYSHVLPLLIKYREMPYCRNQEVDYMIATSACRIPVNGSEKWFKWILSNYSLDNSTRELVKREMQQCSPSQLPGNLSYLDTRVSARVGVRGKTYYWLDGENALTSIPVEVIRDIPRNELSERLFKSPNSQEYLIYLKDFLKDSFSSYSTENFVVISYSGHQENKLEIIALDMERVFDFYVRFYKIPKPEYLITIYLVSDPNHLQNLADKLHGIRISQNSIGYSFQDDLSIIGILQAYNSYVGTLAHELFHLMVRNHFGDIPPWMDEGMAALYEVLEITEDTVFGVNNWRGEVLKELWQERPSIEELIKMDWDIFDAAEIDYEAIKQAANYATARYFIFYLQELKKLSEVYNSFQKRKVEEIITDPGIDSEDLLESILKKNISEVDQDFAMWFATLPINNRNNRETLSPELEYPNKKPEPPHK